MNSFHDKFIKERLSDKQNAIDFLKISLTPEVLINSFNVTAALYKSEKGHRTWTYPLFASYSRVANKDVLIGGGGIALKNQITEKTSITPVVLIYIQNQARYSGQKYSKGFGFEFNVVHQKLRIAPVVSFSDGTTSVALAGGLIF